MEGRLLCLSAAAALAITACTQGDAEKKAPAVIATVNDEPVTADEVRAALFEEGRDRRPDSMSAVDGARLLESLIDQKLLAQSARTLGIKVSEGELERGILRLRADYPGDSFGELLSALELTQAELGERIRGQLLVERLFVDQVFARIAITDDEVDAWLADHKAELERPEQVRAAQIVVKTEAEARGLLAQLRGGADFGELARRHSLSPDARMGGDLGWFARGEMPPPFDDVCFGLAIGKTSEVVGSSYGFHVFKVLERRAAGAPVELREEAEARLRREKETAAQLDYLANLRKVARIKVDEAALARVVVKP
ncbi:peptidylprolyl isomerase [Vulgatibacter incomptus]|uniref:peptidylprolyl isomerase n=1 Tax=Vulgatibacter incomptus TaxID=1391653 RepID=UPI00147048D4|nr:peptidylprolyl isomerase [Vulgatibacter incomptus]